ncbi:hypothetical protein COMA1_11056 [Candidatus Nitrospira nitrosa]|uniref:Uncharacterized protein n=1 Tax=Candidatus Nitrospira nitrosa TaxID=1742972 RepID=A0A0S4L6B2_9BACT|nr:hypothetical protein COMA1_11056 [Candidatus Nitrospira nitrosa]
MALTRSKSCATPGGSCYIKSFSGTSSDRPSIPIHFSSQDSQSPVNYYVALAAADSL